MKTNKLIFLAAFTAAVFLCHMKLVAQLDQHYIMNNIKSMDAKNNVFSSSAYTSLNNFYLTKTDTSALFYDALSKHLDTYIKNNGLNNTTSGTVYDTKTINRELSTAALDFMNAKWIDVSVDSEPSYADVKVTHDKGQTLDIHTKDKRKLPLGIYTYKFHLAGYADTSIVISVLYAPVSTTVKLRKK